MFAKYEIDVLKYPFSDKVVLPQRMMELLLSSDANIFQQSKPLTLIIEAYDKQLMNSIGKYVVGVREFSLQEDDKIVLPWVIAYKLGILDAEEGVLLDYKLFKEIPNGTSIELEPLGLVKWEELKSDPGAYAEEHVDMPVPAGFIHDDDHVKSFLEASWNNSLTSLMEGEYLLVSPNENGMYSDLLHKFKVHKLQPAEVVCVVNTDVQLNIVRSVKVPKDSELMEAHMQKPISQSEVIQLEPEEVVTVNVCSPKMYRIRHQGPLVLEVLENDINEALQLLVGDNDLLSTKAFQSSTFSQSNKVMRAEKMSGSELILPQSEVYYYILPFFGTKPLGNINYEFRVRIKTKNQAVWNEPNDDQVICSICEQLVSRSAYTLHEVHCTRRTRACKTCSKKFFNCRNIPESHWHCNEPNCKGVGETEVSHRIHDEWLHTTCYCDACGIEFGNKYESSRHLFNSCPKGIHYCRFCHLKVIREEDSVESRYFGLSGHEYRCGIKTVDCYKCGKPVKKLELSAHLAIHDHDRKSKGRIISPTCCTNINCCRIATFSNSHGLCDVCFGPFYTSESDPDNKRFKTRLERRYVIQLSRGCGFTHCKNSECKSSGLSSYSDMKEIMHHIQADLLDSAQYWLCVDESSTRRKISAEAIYEVIGDMYPTAWIYKAISETNSIDFDTIQHWLKDNAVTVDEV